MDCERVPDHPCSLPTRSPTRPLVTGIVIGAGSRGKTYAQYAKEHPDEFRVIGVAEPRDFHREYIAHRHDIEPAMQFKSWGEVAARERLADCVIIATQDSMHAEPAVRFAEKGYHILLEKPMASTEEECLRIHAAVKRAGVTFAVCHVLRYTPYMQRMRELITSGAVGDVTCIQHLEPVGFWHFAHSYVRGNWRRESESSFILLAKSCHDVDLVRYLMNRPCTKVSSFGSLVHFNAANKPAGAAARCLDCPVESDCPYSAKKLYLDPVVANRTPWPVRVITEVPSVESVTAALRAGPYGRCVYDCDNDVCDNQVVNLEFEGGRTAAFTMVAFSEQVCVRSTRVFGTRGELVGDGERVIMHHDFNTGVTTRHEAEGPPEGTAMRSHDGADYYLMRAFVQALRFEDPSFILSGADETLESHVMTFAAERSRRQSRVVFLGGASPAPPAAATTAATAGSRSEQAEASPVRARAARRPPRAICSPSRSSRTRRHRPPRRSHRRRPPARSAPRAGRARASDPSRGAACACRIVSAGVRSRLACVSSRKRPTA